MNVNEPLLETLDDAVALFALLLIVLSVFITLFLIFINKIRQRYIARHRHLKRIHHEKRID